MRCITFVCLLTAGCLLAASPVFAAHDCPGNFSVLRGYRPGSGGVCAQLGLNTHAGTCLPGQAYETLCDDANGGRYKTCQGPRRCDGRGGFDNRSGYGGGRGFSQGVPPGYHGGGRPAAAAHGNFAPGYGGAWNTGRPQAPPPQLRPGQPGFDCTTWDFDNNRPCPPGKVNRDCRKDCGS